MNTKRKYDRSFKERAVKLSYDRSSIPELASELGILPDRIYSWGKEFADYGSASFTGHGIERLSDEGRRIKELEKKLNTIELELSKLNEARAETALLAMPCKEVLDFSQILKKAIAVLRLMLRVRYGCRILLISIPLMDFAI